MCDKIMKNNYHMISYHNNPDYKTVNKHNQLKQNKTRTITTNSRRRIFSIAASETTKISATNFYEIRKKLYNGRVYYNK